jgi:type II secretory pathway pseudopilin PulG
MSVRSHSSTTSSDSIRRSNAARPERDVARRAFTITELLVAIGIIVLLIGILLPALGRALQNAKRSQTNSTLQEFAKACDSFFQEFGYYPGLIPENALAADPKFSSTENAIFHLMGGAVGQDDPNYASFGSGWTEVVVGSGANSFAIKVNPLEIGKGPRIAGKQYPPFFSPKADEFAVAQGQVGAALDIPDLLDAWGQPVLYLRALRDNGPLVGGFNVAQFAISATGPYVLSTGLGELGRSQEPSLLNPASGVPNVDAALAQFIRSPAFGKGNEPLNGTARGRFALISAGPDGVYFSKFDGLGTQAAPLVDVVSNGTNPGGPAALDRYDDVRVFGGG